jgi:DNA-binding transcriptional MocR family regulator
VYSNAIEALRLGGGRLVSAPMGDALGTDGWDIEAIDATLRQTSPSLTYLIPDFQNPTGFLMADSMRADYARALRGARTMAIVDETLQPIQLSGEPMPAPFACHATDAITVGSVSKMYWGGLRVGWLRVSQELVPRLIRARVQSDLGSSLFDQLVVTELLQSPEILQLRCEQLRQRRDVLVQALREHLPEWRLRVPEGGLCLWVQLPRGSATRLAADAERESVHVAPGPMFSVEGGSDAWLRIPYAKPEAELSQAVERLARAWRSLAAESPRRREAMRLLIA